MERITSSQNPLLRHIRKLQSSGAYRRQWGEFVGDGFKLLEEALRWYPKIKTVIVSEDCTLPSLPERVRCVEIPASLMMSLSEMKTPQGVLFTCELPKAETPKVEKGMLLLDRIQDPGNLGTILRTADALGVKVLLTNGCADAYSLKTLRASMGAAFRVRVARFDSFEAYRERFTGHALYPFMLDAALPLEDAAAGRREPYALIFGNEGAGLPPDFARMGQSVVIPHGGQIDSLNLSVAAALGIYAFAWRPGQQRRPQRKEVDN